MGFASAVVLDRSFASDDGVYISAAVYYYIPKDGRAIRTQELTRFIRTKYANVLVSMIAKQTSMRRCIFYYRRLAVDDTLPTLCWSLKPDSSHKMHLGCSSLSSYGYGSVAESRGPPFVGDNADCADGTVDLTWFKTVGWFEQSCCLDSVLMDLCHAMDTSWQIGDERSTNQLSFDIFKLVGDYRRCLGKHALVNEMSGIRNNIRDKLFLLDSLIVKKDEQGWQPSSAVLVGATLLRAFDHVRFPQRIAHKAQLAKPYEIIHESTLKICSGDRVFILDLFLGRTAAARQTRRITHLDKEYVMFCVEISNKDVWNGYPPLTVPVKYDNGRCSYVLIGVVFSAVRHFSSMPIFFNPIYGDKGEMISPGVCYYDDMSSKVVKKQSWEDLKSSNSMNNVLRKISSDTGMWPRFFYYCREIVDESLDLCPWGEPESAAPGQC